MKETAQYSFAKDQENYAFAAPEMLLFRPRVLYGRAAIFVLLHVVASIGIAFLWAWMKNGFLPLNKSEFHWRFLLVLGIAFLLTLRFTCIFCIRLYQRYAKSETRLRCCMVPSCSAYAALAFRKYGVIIGAIKTCKRLHRCHLPGDVDYP